MERGDGEASDRLRTVGHLNQRRPPAAPNRRAAAGWLRAERGSREQRAFLPIPGQQQSGSTAFPHPLDHRFVHRPAGAAGAARDDQMKTEVPGLRDELDERGQWAGAAGGEQIVVHHDEYPSPSYVNRNLETFSDCVRMLYAGYPFKSSLERSYFDESADKFKSQVFAIDPKTVEDAAFWWEIYWSIIGDDYSVQVEED